MPDRCIDVLTVMDFYIGTYTRGTASEGIYHLSVDDSGHTLELAAVADNPSWLVRDDSRQMLYAVSEVTDGSASGGGLTVFNEAAIKGSLSLVQTIASQGDDPCHLLLGEDWLVASNYSSGSVLGCDIDKNGELSVTASVSHRGCGPDPVRQKTAHCHSAALVHGNLVIADLGMDRLMVYDRDLQLKREVVVREGAGPRLIVARGNRLYVICELSNTIEIYDPTSFSHLGAVGTLPADFTGASFTGHIELSPDGRFLYASNRGHESLVVMSVNEGLPEPLAWVPSGGRHPRHFMLTNDGAWIMVANRDDNNIVMYQRDTQTGMLDATREIEVPAPVCTVQF